ncbi:MAG: phytoene/squalene synthase family protein [Hyphomonadaceae bacterium]
MDDGLDALVRRVDEDRWLAARFANGETRRNLIALYALNYEIAHAAEAAGQSGLAAIRLSWWREAIAEMKQGGPPRGHPTLQALAPLIDGIDTQLVEALIEARLSDAEPQPFADWAALEAYVDATAGNLMRLALALCGMEAGPYARDAALAWGYSGLLRARPAWRARGRSAPPPGATDADFLQRAWSAHAAARASTKAAPERAFPAIGYVALAPFYLRRLDRAGPAPLFSRQWRLLRAAASGRL